MGLRVETDGLVSSVVASHVALTAVDAQLLVNDRNNLLLYNTVFRRLAEEQKKNWSSISTLLFICMYSPMRVRPRPS
jgi:hypothetical protein